MYLNEFFHVSDVDVLKRKARQLILKKERFRLQIARIHLILFGIFVWTGFAIVSLIGLYFILRGKASALNIKGVLEYLLFVILWLIFQYAYTHYTENLNLIKNQDYYFDGEMTTEEINSARTVINIDQTLIILNPSHKKGWLISQLNNPKSYDDLKIKYKNKHQNRLLRWYRYYEK